jgi:hypothetical protein
MSVEQSANWVACGEKARVLPFPPQIPNDLTTVYNTQKHWVPGLCPLSGVQNCYTTSRKLDVFPSSGEGKETPILLGPRDSANNCLNTSCVVSNSIFCTLIHRLSIGIVFSEYSEVQPVYPWQNTELEPLQKPSGKFEMQRLINRRQYASPRPSASVWVSAK